MKDAYYFSHDSNARHDPAMAALTLAHGMQGYGMYWMIVEMLREQASYKLPMKSYIYAALAKDMMCTPEQVEEFIKDCIEEYDLFESDGNYFWSNSLLRRMEKLEETREKRKAAAEKRWNAKESNSNANAEQEQSKNMQSKVKESKVKEKKEYSVPAEPPAKKHDEPEGKELYNNIKAAFLSKNDTFTNWGKEGKAIWRLVKYAHSRSPDDPENFIHQMIEKFWNLKESGEKFWKDQPFTPSRLASSGIFDQVLENFREEDIPDELKEYYQEKAL